MSRIDVGIHPAAGLATAAKQDQIKSAIDDVVAKLSSDPATQTTLAAVLAKLSSDPATQTTLAAILAKFPDQSSGKVPVIGPVTDAELRAADVKVTLDGEAPILGAGTAFIGRSGAKAFKFSQSFTRLASATPYSAGDAVNNSDSAPAIMSQDLASFGAVAGQFLVITNCQVVLSIKNTTANLDAYIFNSTFAATNDNAELSIDDTTAKSGGHVIRMDNNYSTALNTKLQCTPGMWVMVLAAADTKLYAALQTPSGYTPSASAEYTLIIDGYLL